MNEIMKKLRERKAAGVYFELTIFMMVVVMCLVLIATTASVLFTKYKLDNFSEELARAVEISGDTNAVSGRVADLKAQYGIAPHITYSKTGHINLNEGFKVTLKQTAYLEIGGIVKVPVALTSVATGASEVYWK
ncbi:MAG: DUF4320 family protein [Clostridiales Family XIII bacterium]|jgi:hypothetical protein|nr:DUF4320 family protein [Clostridiales Family XIII bacterium]